MKSRVEISIVYFLFLSLNVFSLQNIKKPRIISLFYLFIYFKSNPSLQKQKPKNYGTVPKSLPKQNQPYNNLHNIILKPDLENKKLKVVLWKQFAKQVNISLDPPITVFKI